MTGIVWRCSHVSMADAVRCLIRSVRMKYSAATPRRTGAEENEETVLLLTT